MLPFSPIANLYIYKVVRDALSPGNAIMTYFMLSLLATGSVIPPFAVYGVGALGNGDALSSIDGLATSTCGDHCKKEKHLACL